MRTEALTEIAELKKEAKDCTGAAASSDHVQDCADLGHSFHPTPLIIVHQLNTASGCISKELCGVNGCARRHFFAATTPAQRVEIARIFSDTLRALVRFPRPARPREEEHRAGKMARLKMLKGKASGCQGRAALELDQGGHRRGARQLLRALFIRCNLCHVVLFFFLSPEVRPWNDAGAARISQKSQELGNCDHWTPLRWVRVAH